MSTHGRYFNRDLKILGLKCEQCPSIAFESEGGERRFSGQKVFAKSGVGMERVPEK